MIVTTEYEAAKDLVDYKLLQRLAQWLEHEQANLNHFIADPINHIEYDPYAIIDFTALQSRSDLLGTACQNILVYAAYRQDPTTTTATQAQVAIDATDKMFFERLYEFINTQKDSLVAKLSLPLSDYASYVTFDQSKFNADVAVLTNALNGLATIIQFKIENGG